MMWVAQQMTDPSPFVSLFPTAPFALVLWLIVSGRLTMARTQERDRLIEQVEALKVPIRDLSEARRKMQAMAYHPEHIYEMGRENCVLCDPPPVARDFYAEAMAELSVYDPPEWLQWP